LALNLFLLKSCLINLEDFCNFNQDFKDLNYFIQILNLYNIH
jgi:hypothetical protein